MIEKMMAEEAARRAEETTKAKKRGWSISLPNSTQTDLVRVFILFQNLHYLGTQF